MLIRKIVCQAAGVIAFFILGSISLFASDQGEIHRGYYRYPAIHGGTIIFTSEGDLWSVNASGGSRAPDNFKPWHRGDGDHFSGWADYRLPGRVRETEGGLYSSGQWRIAVRYSTLPDPKLVLLDSHGGREIGTGGLNRLAGG